ncbi:MFS transporter [Ameyamaea chiangmaiensis]|uniref:MFS transporter n=1 Tax=Ameyamaea chiangmaiensis TaxID=442969 RepID=UPI002230340B|nr:MFS transporter [Ameyamaea chiangmaiensis]
MAGVPVSSARARADRVALLATTLGGALEWYDLILYGLFAGTLATLFFPTQHGATGLLLSLGSFGVAFVVRPLGAAWLGAYADRHGRRRALVLSSALMTVGTAMLAGVPTFATIGVWAPVLVVASRLTQGFAAGGEFGSAASMLAERHPERRGFYSAFQWSASGLSVTLAALFSWLLHLVLSDATILSGAWRIPFAFGAIAGPAITWLRLRSDESPEFEAAHDKAPLREILATGKLRLATAIGLVSLGGAASYLNVYMPTYARGALHLGQASSVAGTLVSGVLMILLPPWFAALGDRYGRPRVMAVAALVSGVIVWPLFHVLVTAPSVLRLVLVQATLVLSVYCGYYASLAALFADLFPARNRASAIALSYALGQLAFGGFTPMILSSLVGYFHDPAVPAFYLIGMAMLSLLCLWRVRLHFQT